MFGVNPLAECDEGRIGGVGAPLFAVAEKRQAGGRGHEYEDEHSGAHGGPLPVTGDQNKVSSGGKVKGGHGTD